MKELSAFIQGNSIYFLYLENKRTVQKFSQIYLTQRRKDAEKAAQFVSIMTQDTDFLNSLIN